MRAPPLCSCRAWPATPQEHGNAELAQLAYEFEESKRQERLKALIEERRRLEDGAGRSAKVRCLDCTSRCAEGGAVPPCLLTAGSCRAACVPAAVSLPVPLPQSGAKPATSSAVAGAEDLVEKEAVGGGSGSGVRFVFRRRCCTALARQQVTPWAPTLHHPAVLLTPCSGGWR